MVLGETYVRPSAHLTPPPPAPPFQNTSNEDLEYELKF